MPMPFRDSTGFIRDLRTIMLMTFVCSLPALAQQQSREPGADQDPKPASQSVAESEPNESAESDETPVQPQQAAAIAVPDNSPAQALPATVIEVEGSVEWAVAGISPLTDDGWTALKLGDQLQPTAQIRTSLRSHVNLQFGQTTTISIRSITHASIEQCYRSATSENVRIGLGYGTVRGGSTEGTIKSDVIVDSPIATLAKRGTEGWEMWVEPGRGRFRISLAEHGLVEAIERPASDRSRSRLIRPGEYATQASIANMWIKQDIFNRMVAFYDPDSVSDADAEFMAGNTRGYSVLAPGGGSTVVDLSGRVNAEFVLSQSGSSAPGGFPRPDIAVGLRTPRPEGNFGTPRTFRTIRTR